jgi:hypothetical protein
MPLSRHHEAFVSSTFITTVSERQSLGIGQASVHWAIVSQ